MITALRKKLPERILAFSVLVCLQFSVSPVGATDLEYPVTGLAIPGMEQLDRQVIQHLQHWKIPGASLAIAKKGRLLYAHGFGLADVENKVPVQPDSLFRTASISKSLTAVAAFKLIQEGKLKLDDRVFQILNDLQPCGAAKGDQRREKITVQNLLQCSAGWYRRDLLCDEQELREAAAECGVSFPPEFSQVMKHAVASPLDFDPGSRYGYSDFDYALLGEVIAHVSGKSYERYVREDILKPMGINQMRLGRTLKTAEREVHYYPSPSEPKGYSLFSQKGELAPLAYGGDFVLEFLSAAAGWISSTIDELRFVSSVAAERPGVPLERKTTQIMFARPRLTGWQGKQGYFSCGWEVYDSPSGIMFSRIGGMPGTVSFIVHKFDGTSWAVAFNSRSDNQALMMSEFRKIVWTNIAAQQHWPTTDLFSRYP